jgi:hypothetical protein
LVGDDVAQDNADLLAEREAEIEHLNQQLSVLPQIQRRIQAKDDHILLLSSRLQGKGRRAGTTRDTVHISTYKYNSQDVW